MQQTVQAHSYLPQEKSLEFTRKYNLSCEDVKKIYFFVLKSKKDKDKEKAYRSVSRSYGEYQMSRQESAASFMSMSEGDVSETLEFTNDDSMKTRLQELVQTEGVPHDYITRIYSNLKHSETNFSLKDKNIISKSPELNFSMRRILIDWLHEVSQEYALEWQTLLLAIQITDQYIHLSTVEKNDLQLVGVTSLWMAAKMEEIHPPSVHDFTYISDDAYNFSEVMNFESQMLKKLDWNVTIPTPLDFLSHFLLFFKSEPQINDNAQMFVDIFLQHKEYTHYLPSEVAAAALLLSIMYSSTVQWTPELTTYSGYNAEDIRNCSRKINQAFGQAEKRNKIRAAYLKHYRKHKNSIYKHVKWNKMQAPL